MKKLKSIMAAVASILFITALIINPVKAQKTGDEGKPIPDSIMKIAEKSCMKCHIEPGYFMAIPHLNLSNWDKYSPEKQAKKAKAMCKMVSEYKMPPKHFRNDYPDDVPTQKEIKSICGWAQSIQVPKK